MRLVTIAAGAMLIGGSLVVGALADTVPAGAETPPAADVSLRGAEGVLLGQVVDPQGNALSGVPVLLRYQNKVVARTSSDQAGRFAFGRLRGGVYQLSAADGYGTYRAWADGTAPRSAKPAALLVVGGGPVRGQRGTRGGWLGKVFSPPVVLGAGVATAVAVPLALSGSSDAGVAGTANGDPTTPDGPTGDPAS